MRNIKINAKSLLIMAVVAISCFQAGRYMGSFHQPYIVQMKGITQASLDLCMVDGDCMDIQDLDDENSDEDKATSAGFETEYSQAQDELRDLNNVVKN